MKWNWEGEGCIFEKIMMKKLCSFKAHFENENTFWKWKHISKMKVSFENESTFPKWKHISMYNRMSAYNRKLRVVSEGLSTLELLIYFTEQWMAIKTCSNAEDYTYSVLSQESLLKHYSPVKPWPVLSMMVFFTI